MRHGKTTWRNVKLIMLRELRDQLRDRRTLFMIFVLPLLLYPLLGMSFFQVAQFVSEKSSKVTVLGADALDEYDELPPLVADDRFDASLFQSERAVDLLEVWAPETFPRPTAETARAKAEELLDEGQADVVLYLPDSLGRQLSNANTAIRRGNSDSKGAEIDGPTVIYTTANEKSQIASARLMQVLRAWREKIAETNVEAAGAPGWSIRPFTVNEQDLVDNTQFRGAATWSKMLPVLLIIWALTGAFYPAIDLCAGEKERGTLETLLCSPAERTEIVLGKLLTIMCFSMITSILNVASIGVTGTLLVAQIPQFGAPPPMAAFWLLVALPPIAALFSALCLTLAAFARSTKEGQYYLMPLLLITLTLVILPMAPSVELNLGNSLIPISGLVLLLRALLEGEVMKALLFLPPVALVTLGCGYVAVRWAVDQFNSENVLFRASERFDLKLWLHHLLRDRRPTPTFAMALTCGVLILLLKFFLNFVMPPQTSGWALMQGAAVVQLVGILMPALFLTVMLTSRPLKSLSLTRPPLLAVPLAVLLAFVLHPTMRFVQHGVMELYPITPEVAAELTKVNALITDLPIGWVLFFMALMPAICEEFAFRGFMLSGFRHLGYKWRAIIFSALFFGFTHAIIQQQLIAAMVGALIAYLVVQSGSLWTGIAFHMTHNGLTLLTAHWMSEFAGPVDDPSGKIPLVRSLLGTAEKAGALYEWSVAAVGLVLAGAILVYFYNLAYQKTDEEAKQEAIDRASKETSSDETV